MPFKYIGQFSIVTKSCLFQICMKVFLLLAFIVMVGIIAGFSGYAWNQMSINRLANGLFFQNLKVTDKKQQN